jgi:hypothetical protein
LNHLHRIPLILADRLVAIALLGTESLSGREGR